MARVLKYQFLSAEVNVGTEEVPEIKQIFYNKEMKWTPDNEEIAKKESYLGQYTIEDDGTESVPTESEDTAAMLVDHEYRLTLLELGLTE